MPKIIQFTHPGGEHKPDNKEKNHKGWNRGKHARKFLVSDGFYVENDKLTQDKLTFWGEWEPPSVVQKLPPSLNESFPIWLHNPYLPIEFPVNVGSTNFYQNTDPLIFGNEFRYFVCKQYQEKKKRITTLAKLEKGDIILFGSTKGQQKDNSFFQLDTVFVVSHYLEYDISDNDALNNAKIGKYRDFVYKMAFPTPVNYSIKLRLYFGATFDNQVNGAYSFTPCRKWNKENIGFPRVPLKNVPFITNNLNAAPKISEVSKDDSYIFWRDIRDICRGLGYLEGVHFLLPNATLDIP